MKLARTLIPLAAGAMLLTSTAALARDYHRHGVGCGHAEYNLPPPPPVDSHGHGRYELRTVSQRVEGRWEQEWVPGRCVTKEKRRRTVTTCKDGRYERRWVPGHYEQAQQWKEAGVLLLAYSSDVQMLLDGFKKNVSTIRKGKS